MNLLKYFRLFRWTVIVALVTLVACSRGDQSAEASIDVGARPKMLATTGMIGDLVRAVVGEDAVVEVLIGSGIDPHTFSPTRSDVVKVQAADIIFYNGFLLEGGLGRTLERAAQRGRKVVAVAERVAAGGGVELLTEDDGGEDPHLWMSVPAWQEALRVVLGVLIEAEVGSEATLRARAAEYAAEMESLHSYALGAMATIPAERRVLITAHDAFGYLGATYGIEVFGIQGMSTESEAGLREIEALVRLIVERGIGAVFIESTLPDRNVRALIEGARARGHSVRIGGELFSDAMGLPDSYEGTYLGMIDHNITTIVRALGGEVPEGGWRGRLAVAREAVAGE